MIRETVYKCEKCGEAVDEEAEVVCANCGNRACIDCRSAVVLTLPLKGADPMPIMMIGTCDDDCADELRDDIARSLTATRIMRLVNRDRNAAKKRQEEQSKDTKKTKNQKEGE